MKLSTPINVRVLIIVAAVLLAIAMPGGAFAQEKEGAMTPHWLDVTRIDVRPDKVGEFRSSKNCPLRSSLRTNITQP
jgi:hypothetical protein